VPLGIAKIAQPKADKTEALIAAEKHPLAQGHSDVRWLFAGTKRSTGRIAPRKGVELTRKPNLSRMSTNHRLRGIEQNLVSHGEGDARQVGARTDASVGQTNQLPAVVEAGGEVGTQIVADARANAGGVE
jgi:hypothetical protein